MAPSLQLMAVAPAARPAALRSSRPRASPSVGAPASQAKFGVPWGARSWGSSGSSGCAGTRRVRAEAAPGEVVQAVSATTASSPNVESIFLFENTAILPFWLLMVLAPRWSVTETVFKSYALWVALAGIYAYLAYVSLGNPAIAEGFSSTFELAGLTKAFTFEDTVAVGWAHFICMDIFIGRWIWADGLRNNVFTRHSLVLALFFGPTGILSHVVTRGVTGLVRGEPMVDIITEGSFPSKGEGAPPA